MNAFSLTPSSLLSKNDVCLRNPFLSYIWWFYFCLFFLELFTSEWFSIYKKKSKAALAALLFFYPFSRQWYSAGLVAAL